MKALSDTFYVSAQLKSEDFQHAKNKGIRLIINNRPDGEQWGQMTTTDAEKHANELGMDYLYLPMKNGQPLPTDLIPKLQAALQEQQGLTLAYCRTGTRSSFLWGAVQILQGQSTPDEVIARAAEIGINLTGFRPVLGQFQTSTQQKES